MMTLIFKYIVGFILANLLHELMHIKGGGTKENWYGLKNVGYINVSTTMTAIIESDNQHSPYTRWYYLRGGLLAGLICLYLGATSSNAWQFVWVANGITQLIYGFLEWHFYSVDIKIRYTVYVVTPMVLYIIWIL